MLRYVSIVPSFRCQAGARPLIAGASSLAGCSARHRFARPLWVGLCALTPVIVACGGGDEKKWACSIDASEAPDFVTEIGCAEDFVALASVPATTSIPGARSVKTSIDREGDNALSFQNSTRYPIHWNFLSEHRSVPQGLPRVPSLQQFNAEQYYSPQRRFLLGALTHYEEPDVWAYEISPYDTADAQMIQTAYEAIAQNTFLGSRLRFHPTSLGVEGVIAPLAGRVPTVLTDELFAGIDYQPLNIAESIGQLRFVSAAELEESFFSFRDIVVLDRVPNDISVTQGIITAQFQTPLSHINVLSKNRGTPNMGLRNASDDPDLRALEGQWVRLRVGASDFEIAPVDQATADAWWEEHKPMGVQVPGLDDSVTDLRDVTAIVPADVAPEQMLESIKEGTRAFGGKAANYAALAQVEGVRVPPAFAVPVFYYRQFMTQNGFDQRVAALLADPEFNNDARRRDVELEQLRDDLRVGSIDPAFEALLTDKLNRDFPGVRMRFRSSTNAEDLDGFTGAGLYTSRSGEFADPNSPVFDAVRRVWASVWSFRAFEERSYRSIDHLAVGMALLVHRSFPDEEANGVAITNNVFDERGIEPAFYVNVQLNEFSVVQPEPGLTTESFLYFYDLPSRPVTYLSRSNLVGEGQRVLSPSQVQELGEALARIRSHFAPAYAPPPGAPSAWWAMDVEFKFDGEPGEVPQLFVKQARPYGNN